MTDAIDDLKATYASIGDIVKRETDALQTLLLAQKTNYRLKIGSSSHDIIVPLDSTEGIIVAEAINRIIDYKKERLKLTLQQSVTKF